MSTHDAALLLWFTTTTAQSASTPDVYFHCQLGFRDRTTQTPQRTAVMVRKLRILRHRSV
jgi:hypothetical protein